MNILVAAVYLAAAMLLFVALLNRSVLYLPDSRFRDPVFVVAFTVFTGAALVGAFALPRAWIALPLSILALAVLGELRRARIRRAHAGSPPLDTTPHAVSLTRPLTTTDLVCHRYRVPTPRWSSTPFRIVHLSDLHANPRQPPGYLDEVLRLAEGERPDLAVITGDFLTGRAGVPLLREVLRPVAALGTFAVLGNHDHWSEAAALRSVLADKGVRLLDNESVTVEIRGKPVRITGYDFPWGTRARTPPAGPGDRLHIALTHTPDNVYRLARAGADFVFAGHFHAGQIRIPRLGALIVPSGYGRRFDHGHFVVDGAHLFVSGGVGAAEIGLRIYCRPDIFVVDVEAEGDGT